MPCVCVMCVCRISCTQTTLGSMWEGVKIALKRVNRTIDEYSAEWLTANRLVAATSKQKHT